MFEFHRNERARQLRPSLSRSWLLVRANSSEEVFEEAFESEADSIIIDLEDGCPPEEKDAAREQVVRMLNSGVVAWVRINAITTEHWWKDVKALKNVKGLRGVMLATAEHATDIDRTAAELPPGTPIIALIESALGVHHSIEIARAIGTFRLAFGAGDYRRDTGSSATPMALAYVRSQLVIASTLGGLPGPIDGPTLGAYGADLSKACGYANDHGMTGKITPDARRAPRRPPRRLLPAALPACKEGQGTRQGLRPVGQDRQRLPARLQVRCSPKVHAQKAAHPTPERGNRMRGFYLPETSGALQLSY